MNMLQNFKSNMEIHVLLKENNTQMLNNSVCAKMIIKAYMTVTTYDRITVISGRLPAGNALIFQ